MGKTDFAKDMTRELVAKFVYYCSKLLHMMQIHIINIWCKTAKWLQNKSSHDANQKNCSNTKKKSNDAKKKP
jgi:hypothetical protein